MLLFFNCLRWFNGNFIHFIAFMIVRSAKDYSNKSKSFKQDKKVFYPLTFIFGSVGVFSKTCEYGLRPVFLWRILLQTAEKVGIK